MGGFVETEQELVIDVGNGNNKDDIDVGQGFVEVERCAERDSRMWFV